MLVEVRDWEGEALFGAPCSESVFIRIFDNDVLPVFVVCVMLIESLMVGYVGASRRRSRATYASSKEEGQELVTLGHPYSRVRKEPSLELFTTFLWEI
jgi:hypothetical protein